MSTWPSSSSSIMRLRKVQGSASVEDFELSEAISKTTLHRSDVQRHGIANASGSPDQQSVFTCLYCTYWKAVDCMVDTLMKFSMDQNARMHPFPLALEHHCVPRWLLVSQQHVPSK